MSWIQTLTGEKVDPINPDPKTINIIDIAHALAMSCRYNGHCMQFYSVAEHCCHMADMVEPDVAIHALMHDASEAYICDIPRPIKPHLIGYFDIEEKVMAAIYAKFNLVMTSEQEQAVKLSDVRMLATEKSQILSDPVKDEEWAVIDGIDPYDIEIQCWPPHKAELEFLRRFTKLMNIPNMDLPCPK